MAEILGYNKYHAQKYKLKPQLNLTAYLLHLKATRLSKEMQKFHFIFNGDFDNEVPQTICLSKKMYLSSKWIVQPRGDADIDGAALTGNAYKYKVLPDNWMSYLAMYLYYNVQKVLPQRQTWSIQLLALLWLDGRHY